MTKRIMHQPKAKARGRRVGNAVRSTGVTFAEGVQYIGRGLKFFGLTVAGSVRDFTKGVKEGIRG